MYFRYTDDLHLMHKSSRNPIQKLFAHQVSKCAMLNICNSKTVRLFFSPQKTKSSRKAQKTHLVPIGETVAVTLLLLGVSQRNKFGGEKLRRDEQLDNHMTDPWDWSTGIFILLVYHKNQAFMQVNIAYL